MKIDTRCVELYPFKIYKGGILQALFALRTEQCSSFQKNKRIYYLEMVF